MKRYLCLFIAVILVFTLISCTQANSSIIESWNASKPSGDLYVSAEIVSTTTVDIDSEFEIKIGIGRFGNQYSTAEVIITAPQLTVSATDGTQFDSFYQIRYEDFDDSKYGLIINEKTELKYFESIRLKYTGEDQKVQECISIKLVALDSEGKELSGTTIGIYYEVENGKIRISTERPVDYSPQNNLT